MPKGTEFNIIGSLACFNASDYYRFWQIELDASRVGRAADDEESTIDMPLKKRTKAVKMTHVRIVGGETEAMAYRQVVLIAERLIMASCGTVTHRRMLSVRSLVSGKVSTSLSRILCKRRDPLNREASLEPDCQLVQYVGPVGDRHSPLPGDVPVSQPQQLAGSLW